MNFDFIQQFFDAISSPPALLGMVVASLVLGWAQSSRPVAWSLFSLCCFTSSLGRLESEWDGVAPPLVFPLEQMRALGRPLTIILLALLLIVGLFKRGGSSGVCISRPALYLVAVQALIFLKTMNSGSMGFAFLAAATFGAVVFMMLLGPDRWSREEGNFHLAVRSLALVGVIFVLVNGYQAIYDVGAITFPHGRLIGTTVNAQLAAIVLALTVPSFMFLIESCQMWDARKVSWLAGLVSVLIALVLTGSRTGALMAIVSVLVFFRRRLGKLFQFAVGASVIAVVVAPYLLQVMGISEVGEIYLTRGNTRKDTWQSMWISFTDNPFFGAPLEGGRPAYGENSWLAVAAVLGLGGLIPLALFGYECVKMMLRLTSGGRSQPAYALQVSAVVAGLTSLLMGSVLEAFLLGNLTFPLFALLLYLSLGKQLVDSLPEPERAAAARPRPQSRRRPARPAGPVKRAIS